jgi:hypothetical protein
MYNKNIKYTSISIMDSSTCCSADDDLLLACLHGGIIFSLQLYSTRRPF